MIKSDIDHYQKKDKNSWMYHRFKLITKLNPKFYPVYLHGGLYLSVVKDDDLGALDIFEEGIKYFPDDGMLNYYYGYHLFYEVHNQEKGIVAFQKVLQSKIGYKYRWILPFIISKKTNNLENIKAALAISKNFLGYYKDDEILKKKLKENIDFLENRIKNQEYK